MYAAGYVYTIVGFDTIISCRRSDADVSAFVHVNVVIACYAVLAIGSYSQRASATDENLALGEYHAFLILAVGSDV